MSDPKLLKEILAQAPQNSHLGSKMITSSEVDIGDMIEKSGCNDKYTDLEECLGEHDRDWRKCQAEVKALKKCNDYVKKMKDAQEAK